MTDLPILCHLKLLLSFPSTSGKSCVVTTASLLVKQNIVWEYWRHTGHVLATMLECVCLIPEQSVDADLTLAHRSITTHDTPHSTDTSHLTSPHSYLFQRAKMHTFQTAITTQLWTISRLHQVIEMWLSTPAALAIN